MGMEENLKKALVEAHKRGDTRAAKLFAENIKQYQKDGTLPPSTPQEPSDESEQLRQDEGVKKDEEGRHVVYRDSRGYLTGGIGRLLEGTEWKEGDVIPDEQVEKWFEEDYSTAQEDVNALLEDNEVPDEVKDVLTNMAFQLGRTKLKKFKETLKAAKEGDYERMAKEMEDSDWATQTPNRFKRLQSRILRLSENSE